MANPKNQDRIIQTSADNLDFWGPLYNDADGNTFSPGFVDFGNRNIWDVVRVNLVKVKSGKINNLSDWVSLPGVCNVRFPRMKVKDSKKSLGVDSTTHTTSGWKAAELIIEMTIWTPDQWRQLKQILPLILPKPGKDFGKTDSFQIHHPNADVAGIKSVVFYGFEGPHEHSIPRAKMFKLHAVEWTPSSTKKAGSTAPPPSLAKETSEAKLGLASYPQTPPGVNMSLMTEPNQSLPQ